MRIGIVVSEFNWEITGKMLSAALEYSGRMGVEVGYVCRVPGAFEIPLFARELAMRGDVDAVVALGAIVKGETMHDEVIGFTLAHMLAEISLECGKPVALGVSGPGMTYEQGLARASEYAERAVRAAVNSCIRLKALRERVGGVGRVEVP